jgi:hypothetical protein
MPLDGCTKGIQASAPLEAIRLVFVFLCLFSGHWVFTAKCLPNLRHQKVCQIIHFPIIFVDPFIFCIRQIKGYGDDYFSWVAQVVCVLGRECVQSVVESNHSYIEHYL